MPQSVGERFEAKVDRRGSHHVWTGSRKADGTGTFKVDGKVVTAPRAAWLLANGPLPATARVRSCPEEPACVRLEHLSLVNATLPAKPTRAARGSGSKREIRPGVWKLVVSAGTYGDGSQRRVTRTVALPSATAAAQELAALVADVSTRGRAESSAITKLTVDAAMALFLEHLRDEKGREEKTVTDYRRLHARWFAPQIGHKHVRDIEPAHIDRIFGGMRKAGLSRSRMNQAKSLYAPFFRWARSRHMTRRDPMADFQLPSSSQRSKERTPPEVGELALLLQESLTVVPDVAPVLALGAVTGMRRGELVAVRRSRILWEESRITVDVSVSETKQLKGTKTRRERSVSIDPETMKMLHQHCEAMDARALAFGTTAGADAFLFSLEADCSKPMPPDYVTKRVAALKDHLGIADKRPETIVLEDTALRLYRSDAKDRTGRTGPSPRGGMSFREIGATLGRTERWATLAVAAAERREAADQSGLRLNFDGSVLALRKFTSSELLDAGFNLSMVAHRQGHGPQVLIKHYAKSRDSADRRAADHLGGVVHQRPADRKA